MTPRVEDVPVPEELGPDEVLVRVDRSAICGTDLHPYEGHMELEEDVILGHEFLGTVVSAGGGVSLVGEGDLVTSPCTVTCGACYFCRRGEPGRCAGIRMFGMGMALGDLPGAQSEYVVVPYADRNLRKLPEDATDSELDSLLLAGDIITTGYEAAMGVTHWRTRERARFAAGIVTSSLAPTNTLPGKPAALKRAIETGGGSLLVGARAWVDDLLHNGGMPKQVDRSAFTVDENMAVTPGAGLSDRLTPWDGCYRATQMLPGESTFVLSPTGHIQTQVSPPGNPKSHYFVGREPGPDPHEWRAGAERCNRHLVGPLGRKGHRPLRKREAGPGQTRQPPQQGPGPRPPSSGPCCRCAYNRKMIV